MPPARSRLYTSTAPDPVLAYPRRRKPRPGHQWALVGPASQLVHALGDGEFVVPGSRSPPRRAASAAPFGHTPGPRQTTSHSSSRYWPVSSRSSSAPAIHCSYSASPARSSRATVCQPFRQVPYPRPNRHSDARFVTDAGHLETCPAEHLPFSTNSVRGAECTPPSVKRRVAGAGHRANRGLRGALTGRSSFHPRRCGLYSSSHARHSRAWRTGPVAGGRASGPAAMSAGGLGQAS